MTRTVCSSRQTCGERSFRSATVTPSTSSKVWTDDCRRPSWFLPVIEWTFIYLPILYHTVYGIWITLTGQPNNANYPYAKNWFYLLQRISAIVIVFFMLFHILALKYGLFGTNLSFEP